MKKGSRKLVIDFLYLDLSSCSRCRTTGRILDLALDEMMNELKDVKVLTLNKIRITSDTEAEQLNVIRSPTIRVNGIDIEEILTGKSEVTDNCCSDCSRVCGVSMPRTTGGGKNCRTFRYGEKIYSSPPKEMIKKAIRKSLRI